MNFSMLVNTDLYSAGGRKENNDCAVRAFSVASGLSYAKSHKLFAKHGRKPKHRTAQFITNDVILDAFPEAKQHLTVMTVKEFAKTYNKGRFIVRVRGHLLAVVDGVVHDWHERPRTIKFVVRGNCGRELR